MKATDLMIGDFFQDEDGHVLLIRGLDNTEKYDHVIVEYIDGINEGECERFNMSWSSIFPIPLTPKILEKNGFKKMDGFTNAYQWWNKNKAHSIEIFFYLGGDIGGTLKINIEYYNKINIRVDYVHELQHALKLCGIGKGDNAMKCPYFNQEANEFTCKLCSHYCGQGYYDKTIATNKTSQI